MSGSPEDTLIYHITDLANLAGIMAGAGLRSDVAMATGNPEVIGYGHIKERRATEIRVDCCGNRFVGEFVPFYFCPRSPMLYTVNKGNTGRPVGCQRTIIHLVSRVGTALQTGKDWAISDGNAGAFHTSFYRDLKELKNLDWKSIRATSWQGMTHQKSAEFLVADFFHGRHFMRSVATTARWQPKSPPFLTGRPIVLLYPSNPLGIIKEP